MPVDGPNTFTFCIKNMVSWLLDIALLIVVANVMTGPVVRVAPDEVDVTDMSPKNEIHTVKATYIKSPNFYQTISKDLTPRNVFTTVDIEFHPVRHFGVSLAYSGYVLRLKTTYLCYGSLSLVMAAKSLGNC